MNAYSSRPRPACSCGQTSTVAAVVLIVALLFPATLGAQWVKANLPPNGFSSYGNLYITAPLIVSGSNLFAVASDAEWQTWSNVQSGIFRSTDNGDTWWASPIPTTVGMSLTLVVNGSNLFAGTSTGVYRSSDNGTSWTLTANKGLPRDTQGTVYPIRCLASGGKTLYATSRTVHYDSTYSAYDSSNHDFSRPSGWTTLYVYRSTDNGENWLPAFSNKETRSWGDGGIASIVALDTTVFAVYGNYYGQVNDYIYRSLNSGETWTGTPPTQNQVVNAIALSGNKLFAAFRLSDEMPDISVEQSMYNGSTWSTVFSYSPASYSFVVSRGMIVFAQCDGNFLSTDSGVNWTAYPFGVSSIAASSTLLFAVKDDGLWRIPLAEMVPVMSFNQSSDTVSSSAGTAFIRVTNRGTGTLHWETLPGDVWLSANSERKDTIAITYSANPSTLPRTGTVVVNSNAWNSPLTITVTQAGGVPNMSLSHNNDSLSSIARTEFYRVTNSGAGTLTWTTTDNVPWLKSNSDRIDTIAVAIQENTSNLARKGTVTVNSNGWNTPLTITVTQAGVTSATLAVTVKDAEDWGLVGPNAVVRLYTGGGFLVDSAHTNNSSVATISNLSTGSGYYYTVTYIPSDLSDMFGRRYFGKKTGITILLGLNTDTFTRNMPYALAIKVFNNTTNTDVSQKQVWIGTPLRVDMTVKNPTYAGAETQVVTGRVVLDTISSPPYVADFINSAQTVPVGTTITRSFPFTPQSTGAYYEGGALLVNVNGTDIYTEGFNDWKNAFFTVVKAGTPTLVTPANNTISQPLSLILKWNRVASSTGYQIQVSTDGKFLSFMVNDSSITDTTRQLTGLTNNTTYYWRVRALNSGGNSDYSAPYHFTTIVVAPTLPVLLEPTNNAISQPLALTLRWTRVLNSATYQPQVSMDQQFGSFIVNDSTVTDTTKQISGLANGTLYFWRVQAINAGGKSGFSQAYSFSTVVASPNQVQLVQPANGSSVGRDSVMLTWHKDTPDILSYEIEIVGDSTITKVAVDTTLTLFIPRAASEKGYSWRVRAKNLAGYGVFSDPWTFIRLTTGIAGLTGIPSTYVLYQNYPNPFNPSTRIRYALPQSSTVSLTIYNTLGQAMEIISSGLQESGYHEIVLDGSKLPSGVYFFRIQAGRFVETKKLLLVR